MTFMTSKRIHHCGTPTDTIWPQIFCRKTYASHRKHFILLLMFVRTKAALSWRRWWHGEGHSCELRTLPFNVMKKTNKVTKIINNWNSLYDASRVFRRLRLYDYVNCLLNMLLKRIAYDSLRKSREIDHNDEWSWDEDSDRVTDQVCH